MAKPPARSRLLYMLGAGAVIVAVAFQVAESHLPTTTLAVEGGLFAVGIAYAGLVIRHEPELVSTSKWVSLALTLCNVGLSVAILLVAAPHLSGALPITFAVLLTTILATILSGEEVDGSSPRPLLLTGILVLAMTLVWIRAGGLAGVVPFSQLVTWAGLLAGLGILMEVHWRHGRTKLVERMARLEALGAVAHRLGQATELDDVAAATLEAFRRAYPDLGFGGILMWDAEREVLESLPVMLHPEGVVRGREGSEPSLTLRCGEGVAGEAFATGRVVHRGTAVELSRDQGSRRDGTNEEISRRIGVVRSAIAVPLRTGDGQMIGVVSLGSNTTERRWDEPDFLSIEAIADQAGVALERGLLYDRQKLQASTDALTGLPNRREFERILDRPAVSGLFSIVAIDLDNLKLVNDEYGHEAGDAVLRLCGGALRAGLRTGDVLARVGGDEFAAYLPATDADTAREVAERLTASMQGVAVPYGSARVSAGCATGRQVTEARRVWREADEALYRAKAGGRDRVEAMSPAAWVRPSRRWADALPMLLTERRMQVAYQPVVRLGSSRVIGYESLARPVAPDRTTGVDGMFTAAVRMGLGRDLDWLCRRAAIDHARDLGCDALVFINIGVAALLDPLHDVDQMVLLCDWGQRDPASVVLEVTEREAVHDRDRFREVLSTYRDHGFRFAMDDVGEGHSTLEMLAAGRPEFIKVAMSLTRSATAAGPNAAIRALVTFANYSGATVVAEGIESPQDVETMLALGVEMGQGFHLGRPALPESRRLTRQGLVVPIPAATG